MPVRHPTQTHRVRPASAGHHHLSALNVDARGEAYGGGWGASNAPSSAVTHVQDKSFVVLAHRHAAGARQRLLTGVGSQVHLQHAPVARGTPLAHVAK